MATTTLGSKAVGSEVSLKVNGVAKTFIVVHQGKPSSVYDTSCDGTWLLMQDIYENSQWHSSNTNDYAGSTIHSYLNSTFLNLFESNIKNAIKQVKIPYRKGSGTSTTVTSGSNGLSAKIFLLSATETSFSFSSMPSSEGAELAYFKGCADNSSDSKRVANGSATYWWLRSPRCDRNFGNALCVSADGGWGSNYCSGSGGIRPALILPPTLLVSDDGTVSTNTAPTVPGSISVPGSIKGGTTITVSWAAATDTEGNLEGYIVERSINGGGWSQIYQARATSMTNTVAFGTVSVAYRVKAYDSEGLQSGYKTSGTVKVNNNRPPNTPGSISVPGSIKGGTTITVSWAAATDAEGNLAGYVVERSTNSGGWSQIYKGSATSTSNAVAYGTVSVAYRVKAYDSEGLESGYKTSGTVTVHNNQAPSAPGSIKATNVVQGETATVTITAATDPDGTVARYVYERSVDGGGWMKVKEVNALTLTDRIGTWTTVAYRAKAVDNEGANGPYATTAQLNVNKPPTAPGSIKVTNVVQGENATVTITAATDPDGTVARYVYERSVDGGGWTKVKEINALTLTDRIGEWAVVAYRARAVDNKETTGPFVTSAQQNVNKNWVYISGPSADMGSKPVPFNLTLSVNVSGQLSVEDINVNVLLDGAQVYSNTVPQGTSITVPIDTRIMRAGRHKIQVTATKSGYLSANKTYTFTVPSTVLPTGGYAQQLQDAQGQAIFPVTTARYVIGEGGQSVQAQLALLRDAVRGKTGHLEFVDALLGPVSDYKIARMRGAVYAATFFSPPGEPSAASVSIPASYTGDIGGVVTVAENELTIKLNAGAILNLYQYTIDTEETP